MRPGSRFDRRSAPPLGWSPPSDEADGGAPGSSSGSRRWLRVLRELGRVLANARRGFTLLAEADGRLALALVALTAADAVLPLGIAYVGKRIVDAVVLSASSAGDAAAAAATPHALPFGLASHGTEALLWVGVEGVLLLLLAGVTQLTSLAQTQLRSALGLEVNTRILAKAINVSYRHFEDPLFHDRLTQARREASTRPLDVVRQLLSLGRDSIALVGYAIVLTGFSFIVIPLMLVSALPAFVAEAKHGRRAFLVTRARVFHSRQAQYMEALLSRAESAKEVKLFSLSRLLLERYRGFHKRVHEEDSELARERAMAGVSRGALATIALCGCSAWVVWRATHGGISVGAMTLFLVALRESQRAFQGGLLSIARLYEDNLFMTNLFEYLAIPEDEPHEPIPESAEGSAASAHAQHDGREVERARNPGERVEPGSGARAGLAVPGGAGAPLGSGGPEGVGAAPGSGGPGGVGAAPGSEGPGGVGAAPGSEGPGGVGAAPGSAAVVGSAAAVGSAAEAGARRSGVQPLGRAGLPPTAAPPRIEFESVSFTYPGAPRPSLSDLTLAIEPGETIAVVGPNGAGKTTLVKLLTGLYRPSSGVIRMGGVDITSLTPAALRARVGVIFQDFVRFHFSVADNIGVGWLPSMADRAAVERAAAAAGVEEIVADLPDGYSQTLGRWFGGHDLSVGQWQRLALSRAFMRRSPVLILDEPTASLDSEAESEIFGRFRALARGRTAILITHRFSTVRMADRIVVLEEGRLTERGTHAELMAADRRYARMFRLQAAGYADVA